MLELELDEDEEEEETEPQPLEEHQKQNNWEGLWSFTDQQQLSNNAQQLFDHVSNDYVITRDEDEPAVLLPTDTVDHMGDDVSVIKKSSGAILIESSLLTETSHELQEVSLTSCEFADKSHDRVDGSQEPLVGSHEFMKRANKTLDEPVDKPNDFKQKSHDPLDGSHEPADESHELLVGSLDPLISQERLTELHMASHDLFSGSHDLTEPLFDDEDNSGTYRHRSLTAASVSNTPNISMATTNGPKNNSFEAIPLATGSKKKRNKKTKKKKKQQSSSSDNTSIDPPLNMQPPATTVVQEEQFLTPPVKGEHEQFM